MRHHMRASATVNQCETSRDLIKPGLTQVMTQRNTHGQKVRLQTSGASRNLIPHTLDTDTDTFNPIPAPAATDEPDGVSYSFCDDVQTAHPLRSTRPAKGWGRAVSRPPGVRGRLRHLFLQPPFRCEGRARRLFHSLQLPVQRSRPPSDRGCLSGRLYTTPLSRIPLGGPR